MRVAIIDLGTNSVRFDVYQIGQSLKMRRLHREKLMVRLGQGVFVRGKLDPTAVRRTLEAFESFQQTSKHLRVQKTIAFGTSALREATDNQDLLQSIRDKTGIDIRVISGSEEARLIAAGILQFEDVPKKTYALVDIGGGSTEISICRDQELLHSESFTLGTARLQQIFLKSSPPKEIDPLRRYIRGTVLSKAISEEWPKAEAMFASSGTARALAKILEKFDHSDGSSIDRSDLKELIKKMSTMGTSELLGLPGMESRRVDMILAGAVLLEEIMGALKVKRTKLTEFSLRDGILAEELKLSKRQDRSNLSLHLDDVREKALKFSTCPEHAEHVTLLAEKIFDQTHRLHHLKKSWRTSLTAAALLHDAGESVSPTNHEQHSYYLARNVDIPSMSESEGEMIAQICLHHRAGKPQPKDLPFAKGSAELDAFYKLLAILRVADALDRGHQARLRVSSVSVTSKSVTIRVRALVSSELELLRVDQKK